MSRLWTLGVTAVILIGSPSAAVAHEAVMAYQRVVAQVCQKKVTPEMIRLYAQTPPHYFHQEGLDHGAATPPLPRN